MTRKQPIVLIAADSLDLNNRLYYIARDQYIAPIIEYANATPIILPAHNGINIDSILEKIDGILLTGAISNVEPQNYNGNTACEPYDSKRDSITLPLIKKSIARNIPLLGICRGMQEMNVALGGSLSANIQDLPNRMDHRAVESQDYDVQYSIKHKISLIKGSLLYKIIGDTEIMVNSLHSQSINELAPSLEINALAEDGTIEAVSLKNSENFVLGVQFHPEYWVKKDAASMKIIREFGSAVTRYAYKL